MEAREQVAAILDRWGPLVDSKGAAEMRHETHLAQADEILASGLFASVWDEGHEAGVDDGPANPYRDEGKR